MKVLIIGGRGQLATDLRETFPSESGTVEAVGRESCNVTDRSKVREIVEKAKPDVIISTAAYHQVDLCEENVGEAFAVNAQGAAIVAQEATAIGARCIWFSTDFVFDGERKGPYPESHPTSPLSVYGVSKAAGERLVVTTDSRHMAIRTAGLIGKAGTSGKGGNFVETMIRVSQGDGPIRVVNDQTTAPTHTLDVATRTWELIRQEAHGVVHLTSRGAVTWYEFTRRIFDRLQIKANLIGITSEEYNAPARRPLYSILAHDTLDRLGLTPMPEWPEALDSYLQARGHLPAC